MYLKPYKIIPNCAIVGGSAKLLVPFISDVRSSDYTKYGELHTGIDIEAESVYNAVPGIVLQVAQVMNNTWTVSVQYDVNNVMRYSNLTSVSVGLGDIVLYKDKLGECKEFLHLEHVKLSPVVNPEMNVRIGIRTYYNQNPISVIDGSADFDLEAVYEVVHEVDPNLQTLF